MQILVFGDSITQGFHDTECGGWVSRLFAYCNKIVLDSDFDTYISVFNFGVSGDRSSELVKRFEKELHSRGDTEPTITILAIGINDSIKHIESGENWCPIREYEDNVRGMIDQASKKGKVLLVGLTDIQEEILTPIPWFTEYALYRSDRNIYDQKLKEIAIDMNCTYISLFDLFADSQSELLTDGLHPNAKGHRLIFERVKSVLETEGIL